MSTAVLHTPEDLLHLDSDRLYELVGGQLVEKQMSSLGGKCIIRVGNILQSYLNKVPAGDTMTEVSFQCFPDDPDLVRRPDIAFIAAARAASVPDEGHVKIAPDLAIEVISPGDKINAFEEKLADYRSAGVKLIWEVNPTFRYVRIHHPDRTAAFLDENDTLTAESLLPSFTVKVAELMPSPATQPRQSSRSD